MKSWVFVAVGIIVVAAGAYLAYAAGLLTPEVVVERSAANEIARLASLAASRNLTTEDLTALESLLEGDKAAAHEFEELEAMVRYGEQEHAVHTLGFLDSLLKTGTHSLCPEHLLAHYYVFTEHGETELAEHSLEHVEEQLSEWEGPAREFNEMYPSGRSFDEILANVHRHLDAIKAGTANATDEEVLELANRAICVQPTEPDVHGDEESEGHDEEAEN